MKPIKDRTQIEDVLAHMMKGQAITPLEALRDYGCFRLAAVIHKLRDLGINVTSEMVSQPKTMKGKTFAQYRLGDAELAAIKAGKIYAPEDYLKLMRSKLYEKV